MADEKKPEELLAEAQARIKELEELNAKQKAAIDNASSDAAKHKRTAQEWQDKYKATLSEQEKAALETKQKEEQMTAELNAYKVKERTASYTAKLMATGYDADTASKMAALLPDGVSDEFFVGQKSFLDAKTQEIKTASLNAQPGLSAGTPPSKEDAEAAELKAMLAAAGIKE